MSSRAEKVSGLSSKVQNILNILKTSTYPSWFEQNITWVKNEQISQDEFISAFDYGVSSGFIKTIIPTRPEPEPSKRPTSIFREPTTQEPVVTTQQVQQKIIPTEQPLSSNWRLGSTAFTTFPESSRYLENASNGNFNDYATFDIDKTPNLDGVFKDPVDNIDITKQGYFLSDVRDSQNKQLNKTLGKKKSSLVFFIDLEN